MKKALSIALLIGLVAGCNKTTAVDRYVQFIGDAKNDSAEWRGFEISGDSVRWINSSTCKYDQAQAKNEGLKNFDVTEVNGIKVYEHPSLGEFVKVAAFDDAASMRSVMLDGKSREFWSVSTTLNIPKC